MKRFVFNERAVLACCHDAAMLILSWLITDVLLAADAVVASRYAAKNGL